jgi:phosphopantothenoylcysteine decarboxylase / phosphopantothenate---cysteine ligase
MNGKRILLGITGGIAAYKIAFLVRILKKKGAEVKCIMTPASSDFISPLTLATLSENPVHIEFWDKSNGQWTNHVDLGMWADIFVIAPLTASSLSKMANGQSDNLLLATYLSAKCPVYVAPAMDLDMYAHPSTTRNLATLEKDQVTIIPAETGFLASGLEGKGRMAEPEVIASYIEDYFSQTLDFENQTVLITAGPTYEKIDPVRFIGNHSSGKMGFEIAKNLLNRGAKVVLISGPTKEKLAHPNLSFFPIESAEEMLTCVQSEWKNCSIGIFSAAVADYRPEHVAEIKIKKKSDSLEIKLIKNPDILRWAGENRNNNQYLVGFALETDNAVENAKSKLTSKNLDLIVLNTLEDDGAGFGHDTNRIHLIDKHNNLTRFELKPKSKVAKDIVNTIHVNFVSYI